NKVLQVGPIHRIARRFRAQPSGVLHQPEAHNRSPSLLKIVMRHHILWKAERQVRIDSVVARADSNAANTLHPGKITVRSKVRQAQSCPNHHSAEWTVYGP